MREDIFEKITAAKVRMIMKFPFFGVLCTRFHFIEDETCPTAATDGVNLYYNPNFIESLDMIDVIFVLTHEVMHCALKHLWRGRDLNKELFNIAADMAIHNIIDEFFRIPDGCMYEPKFKGMSAEEIYNELKKMKDAVQKYTQRKQFDDHSRWEHQNGNNNESKNGMGSGDSEDDPAIAKAWEKAVISTAQHVEETSGKNAGKVPGHFKRMIQRISSPVKDWRILLREYIEPEVNDYTFLIPDHRLDYDLTGCFLPSFNDEQQSIKKIYFWIDTSGSISNNELDAIYSEVVGAINQFDSFEGNLGFFDSKAYKPKEFNSITSLKEIIPQGGGGTDFSAPFNYMNKNNIDSKINIILTDGYCDFPDPNIINSPTIWLITTETITAPEDCGRSIYLELPKRGER